jgi:hypothetical protein
MRAIGLILLAGAAMAQAPSFQNVGTMSQLMINIIYPTSDALFYIERADPKTDADWNLIKNQALTLAESGNLLLMPGRVREGEWAKDSKDMIDVATTAFRAAQQKDMQKILSLSEDLSNTCIRCHLKYRPGYGQKKSPQ